MTRPAQEIDLAAWDAEEDARDRRAEKRAKTILAYGKLTVSGAEQICQIRDISAGGVRVESRNLPQPGQRVTVEMRGMPPAAAVVVWRDGSSCGLAFDAEQDLEQLFDARRERASHYPRGPRFSLNLRARFASNAGVSRLEVIDISIGGLKLGGETAAAVDTYGVIRLDGLADEFAGHIRWKRDGQIGFRFDRPMLRDDLFNILSCRA